MKVRSVSEELVDQETVAVTQTSYVRDVNGTLRVGTADISLDSIVIAFEDGLAAEAIQLQYPVLTLE